MKLIGKFSILLFFVVSVLSFVYMFVNNSPDSYIRGDKFLDILQHFPRDNFDNMLNAWEEFDESVVLFRWDSEESLLDNLGLLFNVLLGGLVNMFKFAFTFIISLVSYGIDLVKWFISLPLDLIYN